MNKIKKTLYIQGMHCISCEMLIKQSSETINGVKVEYISAKKGIMHLELSNEDVLPKIEKTIVEAGYKINEKPNNKDKSEITTKSNGVDRENLFAAIVIVGVLATIFYKLDLVTYIPSMGDNLSLGVALLMGIVASVSICLAIVGSIVIGFSEYLDTSKGTGNHIKTQLSFHVGRIGGFFILGGLLGLIGQAITISLTMTTILTIIVGIVVLWMGLNLLHILPNITSLGFHLPKSWTEKTLTTKNPVFAPLIGALTFFLPCGFTLSMQLIAINTGSFGQGGLAMAIFALGTMPVLFAVGLGSSYIKENKFKLLHTIIGVLIVFFGIFMINNSRQLVGSLGSSNNSQIIDVNAEYETKNLGHDGLNLVPEVVTLTAGKNYELIITPSENGRGCMSTMVIAGLDRNVNRIIKGQSIKYKFTHIKKGTYNVVCSSMGMYQGKIIVQ